MDLKLPIREHKGAQEPMPETEAFTKSPYNKLKVRSIQLDNRFYPLDEDTKPQLQEELTGKYLIAFNSAFEQIHLYREAEDSVKYGKTIG
jgi:hypothetical protein